MDKKALFQLTHGMYVLTTNDGGCFVDAVCQISGGEYPLISVAVMKRNNTILLMDKTDKFGLSVFGLEDDPSLIKTFGFQSGRDKDKFKETSLEELSGVKVIKNCLASIVLEKVDSFENDTHKIYIGKVIDAVLKTNDQAMSYNYYQAHRDEILNKEKQVWVCSVCGFVYDGQDLPDGFICPICGADESKFEKENPK